MAQLIKEEDLWLYVGILAGSLSRPDVFAYVADVIRANERTAAYTAHVRDRLNDVLREAGVEEDTSEKAQG